MENCQYILKKFTYKRMLTSYLTGSNYITQYVCFQRFIDDFVNNNVILLGDL